MIMLHFNLKIAIICTYFFAYSTIGLALNGSSLWDRNYLNARGMFADRVAYRIGDQLEIIINDAGKFTYDFKTTISKVSSLDDKVTRWLFSPSSSGLLTHNGETPNLQMSGNNAQTGTWKIENSQKLEEYRFSVNVVDVLRNGYMVVSGNRMISTGNERYYLQFIGTVRPADIKSDNTVESTKVGNVRFELIPEGQLTNNQNNGFLSQIYDWIHPF